MKLVARFLKNESGATAIEYGLIAALISVAIIGGQLSGRPAQNAGRFFCVRKTPRKRVRNSLEPDRKYSEFANHTV